MKTSFIILFTLLSSTLSAFELYCYTPRKSKCFKVSQDNFTVLEERGNQRSRGISSVEKLKTLYTGKSLTKYVKFEGDDYQIHVDNINSPSDMNDYLIVKNSEGHEMIFSLTCEQI
ncbi:MAG: hypothetical protein H6622_00570 [Halobacteriovoraceae bacterium]|nr:hypothetical protein [Halobacteriovoraceae bacterium]